ncbi:MAG: hypothetical protein VR74_11770, partial [Hyphomonas sp. BRH_c22]
MKYALTALIAGGLAAACTTPPPPAPSDPAALLPIETTTTAAAAPAAPAEPAAPEGFDYDSVFAQDDRPAEDYEQYEVRKSKDVLAFTG